MRKLLLTLALGAGAVAPLAAQQWQPEVGVRLGWTRYDDPNSDQYVDVIDVPSTAGFSATVSPSSLYGIIPVGQRMAIQPGFGWYNVSTGGTTITTINAGARLNVALTPSIYVAGGINGYILKVDGNEDSQAGFEGAVGYRRPMGNRFRTSAEVFYEKRGKSEALPKINSYGVRIGLGYGLGASNTGRRMMTRASSDAMWTKSIGLTGGWTLASFPGGNGDITTFALPFVGQTTVEGSFVAPGPSALSVILPFGQKMAFEPSFDYHRVKSSTSDAFSAYEIGGRVNYAFNRSAYGAVGVELEGLSGNGVNDGSRTVGMVGAGFRFPLTAGLMGRTEVDYRVFDGNDILPSGQATSFAFGLMVPVN